METQSGVALGSLSHVSNWTKLVLVLAGSHLRGAGSRPLGLDPGEQTAA